MDNTFIIVLAIVIGLIGLRYIIPKIQAFRGRRMKCTPEELHKLTSEIYADAKERLFEEDLAKMKAWIKEIDKKIDSGEITTIGQVTDSMRTYLTT